MSDESALRDEYREGLRILPAYMQASVVLYIEQGILPGVFLRAVIANDFRGAITHADHVNREALKEWALFWHNFAPGACHGSQEKMIAWNRAGGIRGRKKTESAA